MIPLLLGAMKDLLNYWIYEFYAQGYDILEENLNGSFSLKQCIQLLYNSC